MNRLLRCGLALALYFIPAGVGFSQVEENQAILSGISIGDMTLRQVLLLENENKKAKILEQYLDSKPPAEVVEFLRPYMRDIYLVQQKYSKVLELTKLQMAAHPEDFDLAYNTLKAVENAGDPNLSGDAAVMTAESAKAVLSANPKPDVSERATQVLSYATYVLYTQALKAADPAAQLEKLTAVSKYGPQSPYYGAIQKLRYEAYQKQGNSKMMNQIIEESLVLDPENEEMLMGLAEIANQKHNDPARVAQACQKLLKALRDKPKPEGVAEADWTKRHNQLRARAYVLMGNAYFDMERFNEADQALRQALPMYRGDEQFAASLLVKLGWANYQMKNYKDALKFNQECLNLRTKYREQAAKNIEVIEFEAKGK